MQRNGAGIAVFATLFAIGCHQRTEPDGIASAPTKNTDSNMHPILEELASLPTGINVSHSPNPVRARLGGRSGRRYTWLYTTTVTSQSTRITIQKFGAFTCRNRHWVFANLTGKPFSADDFAEWYGCPDAQLTVGSEFSDESNWTGGDVLRSGKMKWYFIGHDQTGKRVKGEGIVENLPETETGQAS